MLLVGHSQEMSEGVQTTSRSWWRTSLLDRVAELRQHEDQVMLVLALVIGALTGLAVVAFILLTERMGMRLYPVGGAPWRRAMFPVVGLARHRTRAVSLFSQCARQRCSGKPRQRCSRAKAASRCAPCSASSSAPRQHSLAEFRW